MRRLATAVVRLAPRRAHPDVALVVLDMDARADEAGATIVEIRDGLTHTTTATTIRYIRKRGAKGEALAYKRSARRAAENDGGTG
jgi:hypothetical protein